LKYHAAAGVWKWVVEYLLLGELGDAPLSDILNNLGDAPPFLWEVICWEKTMGYLSALSPYTFFVSPIKFVVSFSKNCLPPPLKNPRNATGSVDMCIGL